MQSIGRVKERSHLSKIKETADPAGPTQRQQTLNQSTWLLIETLVISLLNNSLIAHEAMAITDAEEEALTKEWDSSEIMGQSLQAVILTMELINNAKCKKELIKFQKLSMLKDSLIYEQP